MSSSRKLEREMKLGMLTSRRALMEREKAMEAARNPGVSKFGDCLVSINSKTDKVYTSNIRKINSEIRRMQLQINQKMKHFVKNSTVLNHDPMILVERPPSPDVVKRAQTMTQYDNLDNYGYPPPDSDDENKPGYMRTLRSKARTPSTLTTIDAFTVKARKKKNVWEDAVDEKGGRQFKSTIRPYAKLTKRELSDLQKGYEFHKPKLEDAGYSDNEETSPRSKAVLPVPTKKGKGTPNEISDDSDFEDTITPFITQMASVRQKKQSQKQDRPMNEISFRTSPQSHPRSPQGRSTQPDKNVRFKSPVIATPKDARRKTKTTATVVVY